jgi:TonB family protein
MTMVISANAQNMEAIKKAALNHFKRSLIAPSQFVLTDTYGNRISHNQLKTSFCKEIFEYDTLYYTKLDGIIHYKIKNYDSIQIAKKIFLSCYEVKIIGDARNRIGGYEQIAERVFVTKNFECYKDRPYKKIIVKSSNNPRVSTNPNFSYLDDNKVYDIVEVMPIFKGGDAELMKYIHDNIRYPSIAKENEIQGRVVCTFVVEKDGGISDIKVITHIDPSLDKEAIRVLKTMPKWYCGKQNGRNVRVKCRVPVTFRIY